MDSDLKSGAASGTRAVQKRDPVPSFSSNSEPGTQHGFTRVFEYLNT